MGNVGGMVEDGKNSKGDDGNDKRTTTMVRRQHTST